MTAGSDDGIEMFFSWYRRRLANVIALSEFTAPYVAGARRGTFAPEQHVLIGSGIDALSNSWARVFRPDLARQGTPNGKRWSEFLEGLANATGIFSRIAAPLLADDLERTGNAQAAEAVREETQDTDDHRGGVVRSSEDDPFFDAFVGHARIAALALKGGYLARFRYGEVLYREHRSHWVHLVQPSQRLALSDHDEASGWNEETSLRPRYVNHHVRESKVEPGRLIVKERRPLFTLRWLLRVYEMALTSFEYRCRQEDRDPMP